MSERRCEKCGHAEGENHFRYPCADGTCFCECVFPEDWVASLERAIERTEGQIAFAKVAGAKAIRVDVERAQRLIDEIKDLQVVLSQYTK